MKEELKQAIDFKAKEISENSNGSWMDMCTESIESTLQAPSILRHADPEIMKQAGWVREEEWISVEDRLPDNMDKVIVYTNYKRTVLTSLETRLDWDTYPLNFEDEIITHWKPLPSPPKQ